MLFDVLLSAGCPNDCNGHGSCHLFTDTWICRCRDGWKGNNCDIAMEIDCESGRDEDGGVYSVFQFTASWHNLSIV